MQANGGHETREEKTPHEGHAKSGNEVYEGVVVSLGYVLCLSGGRVSSGRVREWCDPWTWRATQVVVVKRWVGVWRCRCRDGS